MRMVNEVALAQTTPETELIGDRPAWAKSGNRGQVGTEWRFRASPPGEDRHPLVPDVAFLSYERLRPLSLKEREVPPVAPEIVVEILSPDDRGKDVAEKRRVYPARGVTLEIIAGPDTRTVEFYDSAGGYERVAASVESYSPVSIPTLTLPLHAIFAEMELPEWP